MARSKRKKNARPKRDRIDELDGWKTGDICWAVPYLEKSPLNFEIVEFHPNDRITPSVSVVTIPGGKYRCVPLNAIAETKRAAKDLAVKILKDTNIDSKIRPQNLSVDDWVKLYFSIIKNK